MMKTPIPLMVTLLIALALANPLSAGASVEAARAEAIRKYPQLGVSGSPFNKAFVELYNLRKQVSPKSLDDPRWPLLLAEEVNAQLQKNAPAAVPATAGVPAAPAADAGPPKLALRQSWFSKTAMSAGGGSATMDDLRKLLGPHGTASSEIATLGSVDMAQGVTYLMPLRDAREKLGLGAKLASKTKIACAGFPDGLFYYSFDGRFDGQYNRLYLITDVREQVAGIHWVDESPVGGLNDWLPGDWRTYNFVNARVKARAMLRVRHRTIKAGPLLTIESDVYDPQKGKFIEVNRTVLPQPVINAILQCVQ